MGVTDSTLWPLGRGRLGETEIFDVLHNERRRQTLQCLRDRAGEVHVKELATAVADRQSPDSHSTSEFQRSVYNSLHQTHLPKLEAADVVTYDRDTKVVTLTSNAHEVDRYLGVRSKYGPTWGEYYRTVATVALLTTLLAELNIWVFGVVDELLIVTVALAILSVSTLYQLWSRRWIYVRSLLG